MVRLLDGEIFFEDMLIFLTECTYVTDTQKHTDRQTHRMTAQDALAYHRAAKYILPNVRF